ncbi:MAG: SigE family RNA polymerase sigma factor [Mycobacteriales bacterium]
MSGADTDFDMFYASSSERVTRALHAMTGDVAEAQDVVQEAYARAWQRWGTIRTYDSPEAWVRQVAWRLAVSRVRRAKVGLGKLRRHGPPPEVPPLQPDHVALVAALRQIPEPQRRAIVLHHVMGLSVAEVAVECDVPDGTVKARLSRGRATLASLLRDEEHSDA